MEFTIDGFNFSAEINGNGFLTSLTVSKDGVDYDCAIKLTAQTEPPQAILCCRPNGTCTSGGC
jgi:hypothetical protein